MTKTFKKEADYYQSREKCIWVYRVRPNLLLRSGVSALIVTNRISYYGIAPWMLHPRLHAKFRLFLHSLASVENRSIFAGESGMNTASIEKPNQTFQLENKILTKGKLNVSKKRNAWSLESRLFVWSNRYWRRCKVTLNGAHAQLTVQNRVLITRFVNLLTCFINYSIVEVNSL